MLVVVLGMVEAAVGGAVEGAGAAVVLGDTAVVELLHAASDRAATLRSIRLATRIRPRTSGMWSSLLSAPNRREAAGAAMLAL